MPDEKKEDNRLGLLHIIKSVLSAAIGVQSEENREKDFTNKNSIYVYIAAGIVFTIIFVLSIVTVVNWVLS